MEQRVDVVLKLIVDNLPIDSSEVVGLGGLLKDQFLYLL